MNPIEIVRRDFKAQPIICATSREVTGLELLSRHRLDFSDPKQTLRADIEGIKMASMLVHHFKGKLRVHCNAEFTSLADPSWMDAMAGHICTGVVVELVERNESLACGRQFRNLTHTVGWLRNMGGLIALDDASGSAIEAHMIDHLQPEIVKVNNARDIRKVRALHLREDTVLIVERIETQAAASEARMFGATELQGYWCDVLKQSEVPHELTPPGIEAQRSDPLQLRFG